MRIEEAERRRNEGKGEHKHGSSSSNHDDEVEKIMNGALGEDAGRRVDERVGTPQKAELLYTTNDARSSAKETGQAALSNAEKNVVGSGSSTHTPTIVERVVQGVDDGATATRRGVGYL
jgi:hypothetical protein